MAIARHVLLWCTVINYGVLIVWWLFFLLAHDWMHGLHSRWFHVSVEQFDALHYAGMALYNPRSRGLSEHGVFSCEACCIPAHIQGGRYQLEADLGHKRQRWVVARNSGWHREHDGCNIAVFERPLLSIPHSQSRQNDLLGRKNRLVQPDSSNVGYKIGILLVNLVPYIALRLVGRAHAN